MLIIMSTIKRVMYVHMVEEIKLKVYSLYIYIVIINSK
jgi:hypothetical protein